MKKLVLIGAILGLFALWSYNLLAGDTEWAKTKIGNDVEYGILIPPEQYSFFMAGDTTTKTISLDSVEYSRWYKNTHNVFYGFILANTWTADDSMSCSWRLLGGSAGFDDDSTWTVIDSAMITRLDSAVANVDTTLLEGKNLDFMYYRYSFSGAADNKQGDGVELNWSVTSIAQPNDYWIPNLASPDTTPIIWNPAAYNYHTLWYKAQRLDSIKIWIRALVSYDPQLNNWIKADSINPTSGYIDDSLTHFRILTLPKAMGLKFEIMGDTAAGKADYDCVDSDSSGMRGTLVRLQYIQGR